MTAIANFSNVGSGIDFSTITDAIISSRSAPMNLLSVKQANFKSRSDALKQLNAKLITLKDAASKLTDSTVGSGRVASSSSTGVANVTAASSASIGSINLEVTRLASSLAQASKGYGATSSAVLAGGATSATFELRKGGATTGTPITIDSTNNTLAGLRDAINAAKAGITAAIVDVAGDGTQNQLVLSSTDTGYTGRVELVETSSTGTADSLTLRTLNPPSGTLSDLDSEIKINGLTINRSSNTISDAVAGSTFSLTGAGTTSVAVTSDSASLKSKIAAFVDAYNGVQDFISSQYKSGTDNKPVGVLAQDSTLRSVQQSMRDILNMTASTNGGAFSSLGDIGISRDENGKLVIDQTVINDKLKNSLSDVQALFAGKTDVANGLATKLNDMADGLSSNVQSASSGFDASIAALTTSIAAQQDRLTALRASLTKQFSLADAAIGQLNSQGTTLSNIIKSFQSASSSNSSS